MMARVLDSRTDRTVDLVDGRTRAKQFLQENLAGKRGRSEDENVLPFVGIPDRRRHDVKAMDTRKSRK